VALEPAEFLDAASLLETWAWLRGQFREEAAKFPLLTAVAAGVGISRNAGYDSAQRAPERRYQR